MKKIALLKCNTSYDTYGDNTITVLETMWYEVDETEYELIRQNFHKLGKYPVKYMMVDYVPQEDLSDVLTQLREIIVAEERQRAANAARRQALIATSEAVKLERKRKQLEKLKKELGDLA